MYMASLIVLVKGVFRKSKDQSCSAPLLRNRQRLAESELVEMIRVRVSLSETFKLSRLLKHQLCRPCYSTAR